MSPDCQSVEESSAPGAGNAIQNESQGESSVPSIASETNEMMPVDTIPEANPAATAKKATKKKSSDGADDLDFTWICVECNEAECVADREAELMICEGVCHRAFHFPCAGLSSAPSSDDKWICDDCQKGHHQCALCEEYGADNKDVFCCDKDNCGLFFHESCLSMQNVEIEIVNVSKGEGEEDMDGEDAVVGKPHFVCPAHSCWACTEDYVPPEEDGEEENAHPKKKKGKGRKKKKSKVSSSFATKRDKRLFVSGFESVCIRLLHPVLASLFSL